MTYLINRSFKRLCMHVNNLLKHSDFRYKNLLVRFTVKQKLSPHIIRHKSIPWMSSVDNLRVPDTPIVPSSPGKRNLSPPHWLGLSRTVTHTTCNMYHDNWLIYSEVLLFNKAKDSLSVHDCTTFYFHSVIGAKLNFFLVLCF